MNVFVTGIVGTLGSAIALLHRDQGDTVTGCSRNEERAITWRSNHDGIVNYVAHAGSKEMLKLMDNCDRIYHCAAVKHVNIAEESPLEAWRQNVLLTASIANNRTIFISSDKACGGGGMGVYGATKLTAERIVIQAGGAVVRLGNLIGSSGSVFAKWAQAVKRGEPLQVTDPLMTRLFIPVKQAAIFAATNHLQEQLVAPRMKSACMGKVAGQIITQSSQKSTLQIIGTRPGETRHQYLFPPESRVMVDEQNNRFILSSHGTYFPNGISSANAPQWDLQELLQVAGVLS